MELDRDQSAAVLSKASKRVVIASAGSGKTRTLVAAVAHEIQQGTRPCEVCVVTFTNNAAAELKARLNKIFAPNPVVLGWCGTLHGLMLKLLSEHHGLVGLPASLAVADDDQREPMVEALMREMDSRASLKKVMAMLKPERFCQPKPNQNWSKEELVCIAYYRKLRGAGLLDFDMILHYGLRVVKAMLPQSREANAPGDYSAFGWPFKSLFVDETQDSSTEDWRIYEAMPCPRKMVVGDFDQAIYGFRGGAVSNLLDAARGNSNGWNEVFTLETNYRSGSAITTAAQRLIEHNTGRVPKRTVAARQGGSVEVMECDSPAQEMAAVLRAIQDLADDSVEGEVPDLEQRGMDETFQTVAVLCRTNSVASQFSAFLKAVGVPVKERKQPKDSGDWRRAKLLLTCLAQPFNDWTVRQYLTMSKGDLKASEVANSAAKAMVSINELMGFPFGKGEGTLDDVALVRHDLSFESRERIHAAAEALSLRGPWTLPELLLELRDEPAKEEGEGVHVSTIHGFKGKEASVVFLVSMEEGILPSAKDAKDPAALEESRRLCYVAATRAKERLIVSWCKTRPQNRGPNVPAGPVEQREPSRFIKEMGLI